MKYVYILTVTISLLLGWYLGFKFSARTVVREVPTVITKTQTVTKERVVFPDGKVIEREVVQTRDKVKTSPQPKVPQYRAGLLMPVASELKQPTVTASRRLFGSVWADASFDIRHKEILLGVSVEF